MNIEKDFEPNLKCPFSGERHLAGAFILLFSILILIYSKCENSDLNYGIYIGTGSLWVEHERFKRD